MSLALRIALREMRAGLRGGLRGFRVFLLCLMLGVAAIAAVGLVREAIRQGMAEQGATLLGGDAQYGFTYRRATDAERGWIASHAARLSETITMRSMIGVGDAFTLTQIKAVDAAYPLNGRLVLDPPGAVLDEKEGVPGAFVDGVLADRLGLVPGARFTLGGKTFEMRARLLSEPDSTGRDTLFGPRTLVSLAALDGTPMLAPGSLFDSAYRVQLRPGQDLATLKRQAAAQFHGTGMNWTDSRRPSPGTERFTDQLSAFLVLVGLAGLAVGGSGMSSATSAWISSKAETIATLRALGASAGLVRRVFAVQLAALTVLGIALGLLLGAGLVMAAAPQIAGALPFPVAVGLSVRPLASAALFGALTVVLFTLWPLGRMTRIGAARLYRPGRAGGWPGWGAAVSSAVVLIVLAGAACAETGRTGLSLAVLGGVAAALVLLALMGRGIGALARRLRPLGRGRPVLHLALAALGGPGGEGRAVMISLGLGLTVLSSIGQIEAGLRSAIRNDLPAVAPAFFLIDILPDDRAALLDRLAALPGVTRTETAPMLRGVIDRINGRPAREVGGDHWVLRGDRGVTFAETPREKLTAGSWWPAGYDGPPQASFAAKEGAELGLKLGDRIGVNILGREIEATITSFRDVDFSTAGIGFVLTLDPAALAGAPHTEIATVYATPAAEAPVLRLIGHDFPNVTAIGVRGALERVGEALASVSKAVLLAASVTLAVGFVVLIGAAAGGEGARAREAAVLRSLGATRATVLASFALRAALAGAVAGIVAVAGGVLAGWAVMDRVMNLPYSIAWGPAFAIVAAGVGAVVLAQIAFALRPLGLRPARVLREAE